MERELAAMCGIPDNLVLARTLKTLFGRLEQAEERIQELQGEVWELQRGKK